MSGSTYSAEWYQRNREKVIAGTRAYRERNLEKCKARDKKYHAEHATERSEYQRKYRAEHGKRLNVERRAEREAFPARAMLKHAKYSAKKRSVPFDLCETDISMPSVCPVFGTPLKIGLGFRSDESPSLDRLVPALGYVRGNVRVISWRANNLKRDATTAELRAIVAYMETNGVD